MYQSISTTSNLSTANGNLSPPIDHHQSRPPLTSESESDLSEAVEPPSGGLSSSSPQVLENGVTKYELTDNVSSQDEDAIGSDDADYDVEYPPEPHLSASRDNRLSSNESTTLGKRKMVIDEDDFILNDPELYGLRRSVCSPVELSG